MRAPQRGLTGQMWQPNNALAALHSALICRQCTAQLDADYVLHTVHSAQSALSCAVQCTVHCLHISSLCIAHCCKAWGNASPCFWHWVHCSMFIAQVNAHFSLKLLLHTCTALHRAPLTQMHLPVCPLSLRHS